VKYILDGLKTFSGGFVTHFNVARALSCNPGSLAFQIKRLTGDTHPVGPSTPDFGRISEDYRFRHGNIRET
jgi:hypothetical protein